MLTTLLHSATLTALVMLVLFTGTLIWRQIQQHQQGDRLFKAELDVLKAQLDLFTSPVAKVATEEEQVAWSGFRKFRIDRKVIEPGGCCSFYLKPHDGRPLPAFLPGQFLTFKLKIPGQVKDITRCYSLSDHPNPDYFRVTIKRVPPPPKSPELPPGLSSNHFHDNLHEGDILDVRAPSGAFHLDVMARSPVVLIGGGIGVTPVLSMLNYIVTAPIKRETWFFYGVRNGSEVIHREHLESIANTYPHVHIRICYSDPLEGELAGRDFQHGERVSVDLFKRELPHNSYDFYTCGPPPMMESITKGLQEWSVEEEQIHYEAFGPATVKKVAKAEASGNSADAGELVAVNFAGSKQTLTWDGKHSSLLEFAEANGIAMDSGCRAGNCGSCVTTVRDGGVSYPSGKPGFAVEKGCCLACVAVPKVGTVLVLDA